MTNSLGVSIVIITIVFTIVAIVCAGLRIYCRKLKKVEIGVDDWLILATLFFTICHAIDVCVAVFVAGLGEHVQFDSDGKPIVDWTSEVFGKTGFASQLISLVCLLLAKLSILFFYRRIFRGVIFNRITWIMIVFIIVRGIIFFIAIMTQCRPLDLVWTTSFYTPGRNCFDVFRMYLASTGSNFIIDLAILVIPWPNIWRLQLPIKQKLAVTGIFMLGGFICGISVARFIFFVQGAKLGEAQSVDVKYNNAPSFYWTQLETDFAVICACLPVFRPLFRCFSTGSTFGTHSGATWNASHSKTISKRKSSPGETGSSVALHSFGSTQNDTKSSTDAIL